VERASLVWRAGAHTLELGSRTLVMGVLNVTPDSFSDGGRFLDPEAAVAQGEAMARDGADILDVGGESTRPGADPVSVAHELGRTVPVIERLAAELELPISVDTRKHEVAEAALSAGASIVNDVTGGSDPRMFRVVREGEAGMVLMHMRGDPSTMQQRTQYRDVVAEVRGHLESRVSAARLQGIPEEYLAVDPGLGFAKTAAQSLVLMRDIASLLAMGRPLVVGPSRKSFVGLATGTEVTERLDGTAASVAWLAAQGVQVVRVHDVKEMARVVRMVDAIKRGAVASGERT
jgi:dihydropteroate synthase